MNLKRLLCSWHGHNPTPTYDHNGNHGCLDCGKELTYDDLVETPIRTRLLDKLSHLKDWWKCPECGKRFGKHTDMPHLPF